MGADVRKIASVVAVSVALLGIGAGVSQAATVPKGTPSKAVVVERNENDHVTNYKLANAGPMTGRFGYLPVGDGAVYAVKWTKVSKNRVNGIAKYTWGRMGSYRNGPVTILLTGSNYKYTKISITLTQSWYGYTAGSYPPYGHGAHHTTAHIHVAVNDPTTNLIRY
jgi:predicted polyphosphate/ATP-dependent NAD kinase